MLSCVALAGGAAAALLVPPSAPRAAAARRPSRCCLPARALPAPRPRSRSIAAATNPATKLACTCVPSRRRAPARAPATLPLRARSLDTAVGAARRALSERARLLFAVCSSSVIVVALPSCRCGFSPSLGRRASPALVADLAVLAAATNPATMLTHTCVPVRRHRLDRSFELSPPPVSLERRRFSLLVWPGPLVRDSRFLEPLLAACATAGAALSAGAVARRRHVSPADWRRTLLTNSRCSRWCCLLRPPVGRGVAGAAGLDDVARGLVKQLAQVWAMGARHMASGEGEAPARTSSGATGSATTTASGDTGSGEEAQGGRDPAAEDDAVQQLAVTASSDDARREVADQRQRQRRWQTDRRGRAGGGGDGVPAAARWAEYPTSKAADEQRNPCQAAAAATNQLRGLASSSRTAASAAAVTPAAARQRRSNAGERQRRRCRRRPAAEMAAPAPARAAVARRWRGQRRSEDGGVGAAVKSARQRQRCGERRDGVVRLIGGANRRMSTTRWRLYAGKPGERKWGLPLKGSWGYGNQEKGSGAPIERILGGNVQFSVTGRSTRFVSLVLFIHVMILAQLTV
ncbi:hypothetical protein Scep_002193 [Stephania cephalantha]|uniref:Uncharacterized protein n=1 Tax=Stephania cephalantha TaxID=152367 RepID=A0AAP0Q431_9MAGN